MPNALKRQTRGAALRRIVERYRAAGNAWPSTAKMIAAWAIKERLWDQPRDSPVNQCAREIADAMREDYFTDPQGRRVRRKHALIKSCELQAGRFEQLVFWVDMHDATTEQMQAAFQHRRHGVLDDCHQLKTDVDCFNANFNRGQQIQIPFNFETDLAELDAPTTFAVA